MPSRASWFRAIAAGLLVASCAAKELKPAPAEPSSDAGLDSGAADGGAGGGSSGMVPEPGPAACGFASAPTSFALPVIPGLAAGAFVDTSSPNAKCVDGKPFRFELRDMDGDLQPDLVVQTDCTDATIGLDAWNVYTNTGAGFASAATRFALPSPRLDPACAVSTIEDVNGDLKPDLIVTSLCTDATVGTSRWIVYLNGATGFGAATPFALPPGAVAGAFSSLFGNADCASGRPGFTFFDIDGDRKDDLVVTLACDNPQIGTTAWRVYAGSGSGVAPTPTLFPLPTTPAAAVGTYPTTAGPTGLGCGGTGAKGPRYSVLDVDYDFKPDLVVTEDCTNAKVGTSQWSFYRNSGAGFAATPSAMPLPVIAGAPPNAFSTPSAAGTCTGAGPVPHYIYVDLDGNFRADFLVEHACNDATTGVSKWLLYRDVDGGGFAPTATPYALPPALGGSVASPLGLSGAAACNASPPRPAYTSMTLSQTKHALVVTKACNDPAVGTTKWLVYEGSCP
jgi:hypothetical protein